MSPQKYVVLKDRREQLGWDFKPGSSCAGTELATLKTGDYTLRGYESVFAIERKMSTGELSQNITEARFEAELERLEGFAHPFVVCEFTMEDLCSFPNNSGIPKSRWRFLRITPQFLLKRFLDFQMKYKTKFILAGHRGEEVARSLFKRIVEHAPVKTP